MAAIRTRIPVSEEVRRELKIRVAKRELESYDELLRELLEGDFDERQ